MNGVLSGLNAWVLQRASAVYLLLFTILMPASLFYFEINSFIAWQAFTLSPMVSITWILFFASVFAHAWVGIRDVVLDYVHVFRFRIVLLSVIALYLLIMMFWVLRFLLTSPGAVA